MIALFPNPLSLLLAPESDEEASDGVCDVALFCPRDDDDPEERPDEGGEATDEFEFLCVRGGGDVVFELPEGGGGEFPEGGGGEFP